MVSLYTREKQQILWAMNSKRRLRVLSCFGNGLLFTFESYIHQCWQSLRSSLDYKYDVMRGPPFDSEFGSSSYHYPAYTISWTKGVFPGFNGVVTQHRFWGV